MAFCQRLSQTYTPRLEIKMIIAEILLLRGLGSSLGSCFWPSSRLSGRKVAKSITCGRRRSAAKAMGRGHLGHLASGQFPKECPFFIFTVIPGSEVLVMT